MKWKSTQYSQLLIIGNGFIRANVQWAINGKGYQSIVNGKEIGIYDRIEDAKSAVEEYIKKKLKLVAQEINDMDFIGWNKE
jgi:hypothetical protein